MDALQKELNSLLIKRNKSEEVLMRIEFLENELENASLELISWDFED